MRLKTMTHDFPLLKMGRDFLKIQWDLLTMIGKSIILKINNIKLL